MELSGETVQGGQILACTVRIPPEPPPARPPGGLNHVVRESLIKRAALKLRSLLILAVEDTETGVSLWTLRGHDADGNVVKGTAKELEDAFRDVLGVPESKQCYCCLKIKPHAEYPRDRTRRDGLCQRCRTCEKIRKSLRSRKAKLDAEDAEAAE